MAETNQALTQEFYAHFQTKRSELTARLDVLKDVGAMPALLETLSLDVAKLRKELTDATDFLPGYDQRQCELRLKEIEDSLESLRASSAPKPKFSFKRKTPKPAASPSTTPSAPSISMPASPPLPSQVDAPSSSLTLSGHSHRFLTWSALPARTSPASDLSIAGLDHCVVNLLPPPGSADAARFSITALHVRNISDSVLLLPEIAGSALLHGLARCIVVFGCHQYRMHTSEAVDVYLHVSSDPIIEHCSRIRFARYPPSLLSAAFSTDARAEPIPENRYRAVKDFSHIRASPSPNWCVLPEGAQIADQAWPAAVSGADGDVESVLAALLPTA